MTFQTIRDMDLNGKRVLLRADLNVPAKDGIVTDTTRIDRLKPTIDALVKAGAKVAILSHFGRPKNGPSDEFSLRFILPSLQNSWGHNVSFADDCIGPVAEDAVNKLNSGEILLLENVRFHAGEEKNDPAFIAELAKLGDVFVNDAFSAAHRAHASTTGLATVLPSAAGLLMEAELNALNAALETPTRPVAAIVGGAKISTKLELLGNLVTKADILVLGGGMANTFLYATGVDLKKSLCERDMADQARAIMEKAQQSGCKIILPVDGMWSREFAANAEHGVCDVNSVPDDTMVLDIGPASIEALKTVLSDVKTVVWNGPLGAFEIQPFDAGTVALAHIVAAETKAGKIVSVAGGGDTVAALEHAGTIESFTYVSAAGGAFLEWMEGKTLPGVAALNTATQTVQNTPVKQVNRAP